MAVPILDKGDFSTPRLPLCPRRYTATKEWPAIHPRYAFVDQKCQTQQADAGKARGVLRRAMRL